MQTLQLFTSHAACPWCDEWSAKVASEGMNPALRTQVLQVRYQIHLKTCSNNGKGSFGRG